LYAIGFKLNVLNYAKNMIKGQPIPTEMIGEGNGTLFTCVLQMRMVRGLMSDILFHPQLRK